MKGNSVTLDGIIFKYFPEKIRNQPETKKRVLKILNSLESGGIVKRKKEQYNLKNLQ